MISKLAVCVTIMLLGSVPEKGPPPASPEVRPIEQNIINYTNAERSRYGLPALKIDHGLVKSARKHAQWMTQTRRLVHTGQPVGENIAMGQRSSHEVVGAWMRSPGHRANILNGRYKRIGAAAYRTADGRIFWCQQFMW